MLYSVWNQGRGGFDYFEDGRLEDKANVPKPAIAARPLGSTVDQAGWPLPAGARRVGFGADAIGRVAVRRSGLALGDASDAAVTSGLGKAVLWFLGGAVGAHYLLRGK